MYNRLIGMRNKIQMYGRTVKSKQNEPRAPRKLKKDMGFGIFPLQNVPIHATCCKKDIFGLPSLYLCTSETVFQLTFLIRLTSFSFEINSGFNAVQATAIACPKCWQNV